MKNDLSLTFKKVNVRFKEKWSSGDMMMKTKYVWIFNNIFDQVRKPCYIDEFNVSNSSIKTYSWTKRGEQNYWLSWKRGGKNQLYCCCNKREACEYLHAKEEHQNRKLCIIYMRYHHKAERTWKGGREHIHNDFW